MVLLSKIIRKVLIRSVSICLILLIQFSATESTARTWIVNKEGTGDYGSISVAVSFASSEDSVLVGPGEYAEPTIYFRDVAVYLISVEGPEQTIIRLSPLPGYEQIRVIDINDVPGGCVSGFTIRGGGGGFADAGGGMSISSSNITISNNIITYNWCANGGGISAGGLSSPIIENNLIFLNEAYVGGGIIIGVDCHPTIRGNTIVNNVGSASGGAISVSDETANPIIEHNIIAHNTSPTGGGIIWSAPDSLVIIRCNDVWSNSGGNYDPFHPDRTGIDGNISLDPLFCGEYGSGNFFLQSGSPCAEDNVPAQCGGVRMGRYPVNCTTATEAATWGGIKKRMK
jgi:hypothetical protein